MLLAAEFEQLAQLFAWAITKPILLGAVAFVPVAFILWRLFRKYDRYHAAADEPFTELPLRPAGESLRLKLEELREQYDTHLVALVGIGVGSYVCLATVPFRVLSFAPVAILALAGYVYVGRKLFRTIRQVWDYRLGYTGERVVGEELNQLLADGFRVFHDVPFDGFNVDHVIVGAPGVYAVETKTRRKAASIKGPERATVVFDGSTLQFPQSWTSQPLEQARRNARTLGEWLTRATGEPVKVNPVVTLPGWFVERRARADVNVLNPAEIKHSFPSPGGAQPRADPAHRPPAHRALPDGAENAQRGKGGKSEKWKTLTRGKAETLKPRDQQAGRRGAAHRGRFALPADNSARAGATHRLELFVAFAGFCSEAFRLPFSA